MISRVNHLWIIMFDCHIALFSCSLKSWHDTNGSGGSDGSISEVYDTQQSMRLCIILFVLINILFILIFRHVLVSSSANTNINQSLFGSALLGSDRLGSVEICSSKRATSSAFLPCAPSPSLLSSSLISGTYFFFQPKASSFVMIPTVLSSFTAFTFALFSIRITFSSFTIFKTSSEGLI